MQCSSSKKCPSPSERWGNLIELLTLHVLPLCGEVGFQQAQVVIEGDKGLEERKRAVLKDALSLRLKEEKKQKAAAIAKLAEAEAEAEAKAEKEKEKQNEKNATGNETTSSDSGVREEKLEEAAPGPESVQATPPSAEMFHHPWKVVK